MGAVAGQRMRWALTSCCCLGQTKPSLRQSQLPPAFCVNQRKAPFFHGCQSENQDPLRNAQLGTQGRALFW